MACTSALIKGAVLDRTQESPSISKLPDHLLSGVLHVVSNLAPRFPSPFVCRKWHHLSYEARTSLQVEGAIFHRGLSFHLGTMRKWLRTSEFTRPYESFCSAVLEQIQDLRSLASLSLCFRIPIIELFEPFHEELKLGGSYLEALAVSCPRLRSLTIRRSVPVDLPEGITSLRELHTMSCTVNALPENFGDMSSLTDLSLNLKEGCCHVESMVKLTRLKRLALTLFGNQWDAIPNFVCQLTHLTAISLEDRTSKILGLTLPENFHLLEELRTISLHNVDLGRLLPNFGKISKVLHFKARLPDRRDSPRDSLSSLQGFKSLKHLELSGKEFWSEHVSLNFPMLRSLKLRFQFAGLGLDVFGNLSQLRALTIKESHDVWRLERSLTKLTNLKIFRMLACSDVRGLLQGLVCLTSLKVIDIKNCSGISELTEELKNLKLRNVLRLDWIPEPDVCSRLS